MLKEVKANYIADNFKALALWKDLWYTDIRNPVVFGAVILETILFEL